MAATRRRSSRAAKVKVAVVAVLMMFVVAPATSQIGVDYDTAKQVAGLVKNLLKKGDGNEVSKGIRLTDAETGKRASLRLVSHRDVALMFTLEFAAADDRIFPHTLRITADETRLTPRLLDIRESRDEDDPELVLAPLSTKQLDTLVAADSVEIYLRGWDEEFAAIVDEKGMGKLRKFRDGLAPQGE